MGNLIYRKCQHIDYKWVGNNGQSYDEPTIMSCRKKNNMTLYYVNITDHVKE